MIDDIQKHASTRMAKSVESLKHELSKIRTGRAHTSLLDHIHVSYYGADTPLAQVANVAVEDSRTLSITPWEKPMVQAIEKALMTSGLGLNPITSGTVIRVPLPALTEERRREFVKLVRHEAETAKVAIRNIRRDGNAELKEALKEKIVGKDDEHRGEEKIQQLTDRFIKEIDVLLEKKEAELLSI